MAKKETRFQADSLTSQGTIMTHVITDKTTGVQYLLAISPNMGSGLTVLVDADGKPLLNKVD
ncbi:DUF6440 family protein [Agrilactobacillus composti]|nr:DUF6440 family protein [Agrilactobacillus composti]